MASFTDRLLLKSHLIVNNETASFVLITILIGKCLPEKPKWVFANGSSSLVEKMGEGFPGSFSPDLVYLSPRNSIHVLNACFGPGTVLGPGGVMASVETRQRCCYTRHSLQISAHSEVLLPLAQCARVT